ncbi:hypothetical protein [Pseudomonas phage ZQG1]|nr:hypothetical protein [Pseudomonas phage ZQG1]
MTAKILQLPRPDFSPAINEAWDELIADLREAVEKAFETRLPVGVIVAELELVKTSIIMSQVFAGPAEDED